MFDHEDDMRLMLRDASSTGDSYFGNPYYLSYEQYGMELFNRADDDTDEIESVAILGYN